MVACKGSFLAFGSLQLDVYCTQMRSAVLGHVLFLPFTSALFCRWMQDPFVGSAAELAGGGQSTEAHQQAEQKAAILRIKQYYKKKKVASVILGHPSMHASTVPSEWVASGK